jgi:hypothetical protein
MCPSFYLKEHSKRRRREIVELLMRGVCAASVLETMDVLLQHLRSSPVEEQALVAVLLLHFQRTLVRCSSTASSAAAHSYCHFSWKNSKLRGKYTLGKACL